MNRIFFVDLNTAMAHASASELGFKRGEYVVLTAGSCAMRGLRNITLFVTGDAHKREDYNDILEQALVSRDATVIYIDAETRELLLTGESC